MARMERRSEEWERLIQRQGASGMTVARFCELSSVSEPSFYYWKRRLKDGIVSPKPQPVESTSLFREVTVTRPLGRQATVRFPGGAELTFGCEAGMLREVVAQLMAGRESAREV